MNSTTAAAIPPLGAERPLRIAPRLVRRLANGLTVVLAESRELPLVRFEFLLRRGEAVVAAAQPWLAELTVALLRAGTERRSRRAIDQELRRLGASLATQADADSSSLTLRGLSEATEALLVLLVELIRCPTFPPEEFERERRQALEELRLQRATPSFVAVERLRRMLFAPHPYGVVAPSEEQLLSYRPEQVAEFHRGAYRPAASVLVGVGSFEAERVAARVEELLGDWQGEPIAEPAQPPERPPSKRVVQVVHRAGAVQTHLVGGQRTVPRRHPDWIPLSVANALFGGAFHSRLVMNLREQKGYTYNAHSQLQAFRHSGYFSVHASVRNEVVKAAVQEILSELERMQAAAPEPAELEQAQNYLAGVFSLSLATTRGLLGRLAQVYLHELPEDELETYRARVRAVRAAEIAAVARRWFDAARLPLVLVGDATHIAHQVEPFGEVTVWDTQGMRLDPSGAFVGGGQSAG